MSRCLFVCLLTAAAVLAQPAPPDPAAVMAGLQTQSARLATTWLHSDDPRTQAWGAYLALRDRRSEAIPDLLALLAKLQPSQPDPHDAMLAVLDALIQMDAQVPVSEAQRIYPAFPVQSLLLLARAEDATPALLDIFNSDQPSPAAWLATGNLLVTRSAEGFALAILERMTVNAVVMVTEPGGGGGFGGSNFCCGGGATAPSVGWPPVGVYGFAGCGNQAPTGGILLAAGTDPVYYQRPVTTSYRTADGACACHPDPDLVRQHYLTALLNDSAEEPPVRAHVTHTILWSGPDAYRGALLAFIDGQQQVFAKLARRLGDAELLSATEARTLRPKLEILLWDQRPSPAEPLPDVPPPAGNVTIRTQ